MYKLDKISHEIIKTICEIKKISIRHLCEKLSISRRNFYYKLKMVNDWLEFNQFEKINNDRINGLNVSPKEIKLILSQLDKIKTRNQELDIRKRIVRIIIWLSIKSDTIFIEDINLLNKVSRNTSLSDIKQLNKEYKNIIHFKIKQGYVLNLSGLPKQLFIFSIIQKFSEKESSFINSLLLNELISYDIGEETINYISINNINEIEFFLGRQFTDQDRKNLKYILLISILNSLKFNEGSSFNVQQTDYLKNLDEWLAVKKIQNSIQKSIQCSISENEALFITLVIATLKIHHFSSENNVKDIRLIGCIRLLISEFQRLAGVIFSDKIELEQQLFIHLKSAIQRALFNFTINNSLCKDIQKGYAQIFLIMRRAISIVESEYNLNFNDDELCYIVMIFIACLNRSKSVEEKRILLITQGGVSSTMHLKQQLQNITILPLIINIKSISEYLSCDIPSDIDLIVSTTDIPIKNTQIPFLKVKYVLDNRELLHIRHILEDRNYLLQIPILIKMLMEKINNYIPNEKKPFIQKQFNEIIHKHTALIGVSEQVNLSLKNSLDDRIVISRKKMNWESVLKEVSLPLINQNIISNTYLRKIIHNIEKYGMYMYLSPQIALLHGEPLENLKKPVLSMMKVTKPIDFLIGKHPAFASLIFFLVPEKTNSHIQLLEQLNIILSDPYQLNKLLKATSIEQIKDIMFGVLR